jgi:hypothetical protein
MAISVAPLTTTVMSAVSPNRVGVASGINNAVSRAAALLAIAVLGIVMLKEFNRSLDQHLSKAQVPAATQRSLDEQRINLAAATLPKEIAPSMREMLRKAIDDSFVHSFRMVMLIGAGLALASAIASLSLIGGHPKSLHDQ